MPILDRRIVYRVINRTAPGLNSVRNDIRRTQRSAVGLAGGAKVAGVAFGGLAAVGVAGLTKLVSAQLKSSDEMQKMGLRIGVGTETLSRWKFAAEQSGTSLDTLVKGQQRFARVLDDAGDGLATSVRTLEALGLTYDDLRGKSPEQQFSMLAQAISEVDDPTRRLALAQETLGRSGAELIPLLLGGSKGLAELGAQAERTGNILDQDTADAAARTNDTMNRVTHSVKGLGLALFSELIPAVEGSANALESLAGGLLEGRREAERLKPHMAEANDILREQERTVERAAVGWSHLRNRQADQREIAGNLAEQQEVVNQQMRDFLGASSDAADGGHRFGDALSFIGTAADQAQPPMAGLIDLMGQVKREADIASEGIARALRNHRLIQQNLRRTGSLVPGQFGGFSSAAQMLEIVFPDDTDTVSSGGGGGGGVGRTLEEQLTEEERARETLEEQLLQMYADARISEDTYFQLRDSTDLQATLNDLVGAVSADEVRALESVRSAAWRAGLITAEGSRTIVGALGAVEKAIRDEAAKERAAASGRGGPTELDVPENLQDSLGGGSRIFTRGNRVVAVSGSHLTGIQSESHRRIVEYNRARREGRLTDSGEVIPALGSGGITTGPTVALIGEKGPEAVIPLSQLSGGDLVANLVLDGRTIGRFVIEEVNRAIRRGEITVTGTL